LKSVQHILLGFLIGYLVAFIIPCWLAIPPFVVFGFIALFEKIEPNKRKVLYGFAGGFITRIVIAAIVLLTFWHNPHYLPMKEGQGTLYFLLLGSEISLYEKIIGHYEDNISPEKDPFSGRPPKQTDEGQLYSIGPDGIDNALTIIYDPTNGVGSPGDIPILP
jgi:hypothetical protein